MKKLLALLLAAACALSMAACAAAPADTIGAETREPSAAQLAAPPAVSMVKYEEDLDGWYDDFREKTTDMTDPATVAHWFTTSIPTLMQDGGEENRVCSPLNIYMALSMLAAVTDGETRQQILAALGTDSLEQLQAQAAQLWKENSWDDGVLTSTLANSIWLKDGYTYNEDTLKKLGEDFYAAAFSGEMGSDAYDSVLHDWINDHTGGLLTEQANGLKLKPETVLALVSTIYYSAQWRDHFLESRNTQDTFHAPSGDVTAEFMHSSNPGTVYYGAGFTATGLSVQNGGTMWLMKPDEDTSAADLLQSEEALGFLLANGEWSQTQDGTVNLSLPKFDVSSDLDLLGALSQLGMTDVLDAEKADFTPLTTANDASLALTEARHAARVKIDEDGCEAAAYTVLAPEATAMMGPEDEIDFTLDCPFVFAITGVDGLPLFVGLVNQPA